MAEVASADQGRRGGFGRGFGGRGGARGGDRGGREGDRGGRGRGRGGDRGGRGGRGRGDKGEPEWIPVTKLGRLVKDKLIGSIEELYLHSLPVKEYQIIDSFFPEQAHTPSVLKDEVMKIMPVQKQTQAGQRTRFKAFVLVGDKAGHVGLGVKCSKEVATAIRGAIILAKLSVIPVRRGYWGNNIGAVHTVPTKVTGKCGSVRVRLVPAPRGTGIVAARVPKKLLTMSGIEDVYTSAQGSTKTLGNFVKATFNAIKLTYGVLTPDLWPRYALTPAPVAVHAKYLASVKNLPAKKGKDYGQEDERRGGDRGGYGGRGGREGGYGGRREGGFGGDRGDRQGGEGGYGGDRGGFRGRREGGFGEGGERPQGGFGGRREGGFGGDRGDRQGGEGGFGGRGQGDREGGERREGGFGGREGGFGGRGGFRGRGGGFGGRGGDRGDRQGGEGGFGGRGQGGEGGFGGGRPRGGQGGDQGPSQGPAADQE